MEGYKATFITATKELNIKERIAAKQFNDCTQLDDATKEAPLVIEFDYYVDFNVHNEFVRDQNKKDYRKRVIVTTDGERYITGSETLMSSMDDILDELKDEEGYVPTFKFYRKPSKNYAGKDFLSCTLV